MAARKRPSGPKTAGRLERAGSTVGCLAVLALGLTGCSVDDGSTVVPPPTETERQETVTVLQRSAEAQGVCYGWRLLNGGSDVVSGGPDVGNVVSVGSNLGDTVAVDSDPARCRRWVEVVANVIYTDETSESEDSARVRVESSEPLSESQFTVGLEQLGLGNDAFIDEPGWAICRAAVSLPLLMAEQGHAAPAPVPTVTPTAAPTPPPAAGSDFVRDRGGYMIAVVLLFVVTAVLFVIGWYQRRHELAVPPKPPGPPPRPGPPPSGPPPYRGPPETTPSTRQ
jgi:hypothetical protein